MVNLFKIYLTTSDPTSSDIPTGRLSLGGFASRQFGADPDSIYEHVGLSKELSDSDEEIQIDDVPPNSQGLISVGPEIINFLSYNSSTSSLTGLTRGVFPEWSFGSDINSRVYFLNTDGLFSEIPTDLIEYRCIAVQFQSDPESFSSIDQINVLIRQSQFSTTTVDFGIEVPKHNQVSGTASVDSTTTTNIIDSSLSSFDNDIFIGSHISINGSFDAVVTDFDNTTGEITFDRVATLTITAGTSYVIFTSPSQRIVGPGTSPEVGQYFFGFYSESGVNNPGYRNKRIGGDIFSINDLFYIWLKRTTTINQKEGDDEGLILSISYEVPSERDSIIYPDVKNIKDYSNIVVLTGSVLNTLNNYEPVPDTVVETTYNSITYSSTTDAFGMYLLEVPSAGSGSITLVLNELYSPSPSSISWTGSDGNKQGLNFTISQTSLIPIGD